MWHVQVDERTLNAKRQIDMAQQYPQGNKRTYLYFPRKNARPTYEPDKIVNLSGKSGQIE